MSVHPAKPQHEVAYQDICTLIAKHKELPAIEILAIAANMVGKLVALQDQRSVTPAMAMEIVAKNLECGNEQALAEVLNSKGRACGIMAQTPQEKL